MNRENMNNERKVKEMLATMDSIERVKLIRVVMLVQEATAELNDDEKDLVREMWEQNILKHIQQTTN